MPREKLDRDDVIRLVRERFGVGATLVGDDAFQFTLYEAFVVQVRADDYGSGDNWGIAVYLGPSTWASRLLGERLSLRQTREQLRDALDVLDRYCRLRLGDAYLAARGD